MKKILFIVALITLAFLTRSIAGSKPSRGWWLWEQGHAERLIEVQVTSIILWEEIPLNHKKASKYWIEVTLENPPKSNAEYKLATDEHWIGIRSIGNKWTMCFYSIEAARESVEYLRNYYKLDSKQVSDKTKT